MPQLPAAGLGRNRGRRRRSHRASALALLLALCVAQLGTGIALGMGRRREVAGTAEERAEKMLAAMNGRRTGGPGSAPPSCKSKCGECEPCAAVHVPIHPGLSEPLEYYPEAWRCQCQGKLYMP